MAEVLVEYTPTYAQLLDENARLGRLMRPPPLRWPTYLRVPFFLLALLITGVAGGVLSGVSGNIGAVFAAAIVFGAMALLWGWLVARSSRSQAIKWLEATYGAPTTIRILADEAGVVVDGGIYTMSAQWSSVDAIEFVGSDLFVRSKGLNILLSKAAFGSSVRAEKVLAALMQYRSGAAAQVG
jgi:hypothetical protein